MMNAWNLIWLLPLAASGGYFAACLCYAARDRKD